MENFFVLVWRQAHPVICTPMGKRSYCKKTGAFCKFPGKNHRILQNIIIVCEVIIHRNPDPETGFCQ